MRARVGFANGPYVVLIVVGAGFLVRDGCWCWGCGWLLVRGMRLVVDAVNADGSWC